MLKYVWPELPNSHAVSINFQQIITVYDLSFKAFLTRLTFKPIVACHTH